MAFLLPLIPLIVGGIASLGTSAAAGTVATAAASGAVALGVAAEATAATAAIASAATTTAAVLATPIIGSVTVGSVVTGMAAGAIGGATTAIGNEIVSSATSHTNQNEAMQNLALKPRDQEAINLMAKQAMSVAKNYEGGPGGRITANDIARASSKYGVYGPASYIMDQHLGASYRNNVEAQQYAATVMQQYARDRLVPVPVR